LIKGDIFLIKGEVDFLMKIEGGP